MMDQSPLLQSSTSTEISSPQKLGITSLWHRREAAAVAVAVAGDGDGDDVVNLTWEDLWVTVPDGTGGSKTILQDVTGYARPDEVLAIMGPSGSGKTTLLDALAGRLDPKARQSGDILINGHDQTLAYGTSAYVTQDETLLTTLTVRETVYYSAQLQLPKSMSKSEKKERAESTIREMGLQDSVNTIIGGGWRAKGISGGEKRRVCICIEILTHPKLLFLDEPTSGLDSAASYYVIKRILNLDQSERRTIIASIHQPSSEVFGLFHNLCLLSGGRTIYFGPTSSANEFFTVNGFPCPSLQNPSDHFLRTINKDFDEVIEQGSNGRKPTEEVISILVESYKSCNAYQEVRNKVDEICKQGGEILEERRSHSGFTTQCLVLTRRSFVNMYRDLGYYWFRLAIYMGLAISLGTIYYHLGSSYSSVQPKSSLLMFVSSFLTFMTIGGFPSFVEDMKVFAWERLNGHYAASAFMIANLCSSIPYLLLCSLAPGALVYYMTGLRSGFEHFAYYIAVVFVCMMLIEGLMMMVASLVPNFLTGIIVGAGVQGLFTLSGGFFRLPDDLPTIFWKYPLYYLSFNKFAYQGLFKNQFEGETFVVNEGGRQYIIDGDSILSEVYEVEMGYSKWINLVILLGMVVFYRVLFLVIIKSKEKFKPALRGFMSGPRKPSKLV